MSNVEYWALPACYPSAGSGRAWEPTVTIIAAFVILINDAYPPPAPPIHEMPLLLSHYWPYDDAGQLAAYNGQADSDPAHFATMVEVDAALAWQVGACIDAWLGATVVFTFDGVERRLRCVDQFGDEEYRAPLWHRERRLWAIPLDTFTPEQVSTTVGAWRVEWD